MQSQAFKQVIKSGQSYYIIMLSVMTVLYNKHRSKGFRYS